MRRLEFLRNGLGLPPRAQSRIENMRQEGEPRVASVEGQTSFWLPERLRLTVGPSGLVQGEERINLVLDDQGWRCRLDGVLVEYPEWDVAEAVLATAVSVDCALPIRWLVRQKDGEE